MPYCLGNFSELFLAWPEKGQWRKSLAFEHTMRAAEPSLGVPNAMAESFPGAWATIPGAVLHPPVGADSGRPGAAMAAGS